LKTASGRLQSLALVLALAGCAPAGSSSTPLATPSAANAGSVGGSTAVSSHATATVGPVGVACLESDEQAKVVQFHSDSGVPLGGVILGEGPVGVVLAHESRGDLCDWLPYGRDLVKLGYRVLAFDLNGLGSSPRSPGSPGNPRFDLDVAAAVDLLRAKSATKIVLVGANLGGLASLVAATEIEPPVDGLIDLSGQGQISGLDGIAAARRLRVAVLYFASDADEFLPDTKAVFEATAVSDKRLEVINTIGHGASLVDPTDNPKAADVRSLIEAFIGDHT
jgi:pimeloyl-ACP methyl ester carboxylesterase